MKKKHYRSVVLVVPVAINVGDVIIIDSYITGSYITGGVIIDSSN